MLRVPSSLGPPGELGEYLHCPPILYDVTVSGGDLASFNGTVGLNLAPGQNIKDLAGNALPAGEPATDQTYLVDNTSAGVTSILRQNPLASSTNLSSVTFRVTFTDNVQNVDTTDFSLGTTGTATGAISAVVVQSAGVYDVVITGVGGNGVLGIDLAASPPRDIADLVGNPLGATPVVGIKETYTIDTAGATITSIRRQTPSGSPTNAASVTFRVTFADDVQDVDAADFALATTGTATGTVNSIVVQSASVHDLVITGVGGDGTLDLDPAAANNIADLTGNPLGPTPTIGIEETYAIDHTEPTVTISQAAGQDDPTSSSPVTFAVVFSEPVTGFATGDVTIGGTAGATAGTVSEVAPADGTTYQVAVSGMMIGGTVVVTIAAGVAQDAASNQNTAASIVDNSVHFLLGTTVTLTASPNPSALGQGVTFRARVTASGGTPTGDVTFRDGTTVLGTVSLSAGEASLVITGLAAGTHTITAEYGGDGSFATSASSDVDQVVQPSSTVQIPTLDEWGMVLLMALLAGLAAYRLRARSASYKRIGRFRAIIASGRRAGWQLSS